MYLAIEYAIRTGCIKALIKFPLSIFIEHKKIDDKIVVVINQKGQQYSVKHWFVSRCENQYFPSFAEFYIDGDIFKNYHVIVPNYYLLKFTPNHCYKSKRQYNDFPLGLAQEQEYQTYINTFYNPEENTNKRVNWLWDAFKTVNKQEINKYDNVYSYPYFGYGHVNEYLENQRIKIESKSKKLWKNWLMWRKYLLDFNLDIASELIFMKEYNAMNDLEDLHSIIF